MSLLLALFLVIHAAIHIGYICGLAWPFIASDPWLVTAVWIAPDAVRTAGTALVLVTFAAFLLAALTATGFGRSRWRPLVIVASVAYHLAMRDGLVPRLPRPDPRPRP